MSNETAPIMSVPEELLMLTRMQQRDRGYTDSVMRSAARKIECLCAAGDLLAHDLAKYGRSNDGWWAVRGGHQNCTVCSETPAMLCPHGFALADNICGPCSEGRPNIKTEGKLYIASGL